MCYTCQNLFKDIESLLFFGDIMVSSRVFLRGPGKEYNVILTGVTGGGMVGILPKRGLLNYRK